MCRKIILFCVLFASLLNAALSVEDVTVKTSLGNIKGKHRKSYDGRTFISFEGIPYAKPPIGDLRFKNPEPIEPWKDTLVADKTYVCMQYTLAAPEKGVKGNEDCLYLNVYVPRRNIRLKELLPVVVFIHEGAFTIGDPKSRAGPEYLMDRDVILVTLNYRLGVLGFLSTCDAASPGNYGLKDQSLALRWVKRNIIYFGGNPDSITLFGQSAGGASVHYHYISPLSFALFNRGFSQSGTFLNQWALTRNPLENAIKLAKAVKCENNSTTEIVDCIRKAPVGDVVTAMSNFFTVANALPEVPFGPSIEPPLPGAFLIDHPYKLLLEGHIQDLPWITSNTKDEGIIYAGIMHLAKQLEEFDKRWDEWAPTILGYNNSVSDSDKKAVSKLIREHYLQKDEISLKNIQKLIDLFSDRKFILDAIKAARLQSTKTISPVYYYRFDYKNQIPLSYKAGLSLAGHSDDTRLMLAYEDNPKELSEFDIRMKDILLDLLYSYAKTGIPDVEGVPWLPVSLASIPLTYVRISSPDRITAEANLNLEPFNFWQSLPLLENERYFHYILHSVQLLPVYLLK